MSDDTIVVLAFLILIGVCFVFVAAYSMFTEWLAYKREQTDD